MADAGTAGGGQPSPRLNGPDRGRRPEQQRSCLSTDGGMMMSPAAMEAGVSAVSALTEPGGPETELMPTAPAPPQREASHHSIWSAAASSVFSFWPTPYTTDQRTGRRVSILRKLYRDKERRSRRQRLTLSAVCLLLYLGAAVWAYGYGLERFGAIRALYFAIMTLTTIGYGDIIPSSRSSRLFTVFFALAGICIAGVGLTELVGHLIEQNNKQMDSLKEAVSRKIVDAIQRRRQKDTQEQELAQAQADATDAGFSMLAVADGAIDELVESGGGSGGAGGGAGGRQQGRRLPRLVGSTAGPSLISASTVGLDGLGGGSTFVARDDEEAAAEAEAEVEGSACHGGWAEFALVVVKALVPVVVVNLVGAVVVGLIEGWSAINVLYWAVMSATTIGYGDIHPDKQGAYLVALFYLPLAVITVANAINSIAAFLLHQREEQRQLKEVLKLVGSWEMLGSMDRDQDGEVSLGDFMGYLLRLWGLVDDQTLRLIEARYAELDVEGAGILRREDFSGRRPGRGGGGGAGGVGGRNTCESCSAAASVVR